jgi:hypothetical protein
VSLVVFRFEDFTFFDMSLSRQTSGNGHSRRFAGEGQGAGAAGTGSTADDEGHFA